MTYQEKLKDPRWQKKRLQVMDRDGFSCQVCGDSTNQLQVHHLYYEKDKDPWDYELETLITLCGDCHNNEYECRNNEIKVLKLTMAKKHYMASDILEIAAGLNYSKIPYLAEIEAVIISWCLQDISMCKKMAAAYFKHLETRNKNKGIK